MIYLVPSDKSVRPDYIIAMQNAVLHVQAFYLEQMLNGHAFTVHTPVVEVYTTGHASDFYSTGPNAGTYGFWESVLGDGFRLTGGGFNDPENRWIFYIDAPGGCGQVAGGGTAGVAVMGHNDLRGLTGQSYVPQCPGEPLDERGVCRYVGGLGHELGHAFNLPHPPGCDQGDQTRCGALQFNSLMYLGFELFPRTHLLDQDRASLMATGFFAPFNLETPGSSFCSSMTAQSPNPIDSAGYFVRWQYKDFLTREPDDGGFAHWKNVTDNCGDPDPLVCRINVSAAFFLSIEFQQTGYLVERIYKASYGDAVGTSTLGGTHQLPVPVVRLEEFLPDTQRIGQGVVVLAPGWEARLEANKTAFTREFVQRPRFLADFPLSLTPADFVDRLNGRAGAPLDANERQALIDELTANNTTAGRASVLRKVAEDPTLEAAEKSRAFVLMQYFGYLRRDPNEGQDADYTGYDFWLGNLEKFGGNFVQAELVKAFIQSAEYRGRFGQ